jgi:hypothetical protein
MFALLLEFLAVVEDADIIEATLLVVSEDIMAEVAFDEAMLGIVYEEYVGSLATFQSWLAGVYDVTQEVVNALFGLQMLYNLVYGHYQRVVHSKRCVSVSQALLDTEATLKKNYAKIVAGAQKAMASPAFAKLSPGMQERFRQIAIQSPMEYWLSVRQDILTALRKNPLYAP